MGITLATALLFGLVPALQGSRASPGAVLKEEAGSIAGGQVRLRKFFSDMRTLDDQLNRRLSNERLLSFLSVGFALLASLLAVIGLHGALSFVVARRTREIGIRIALGADRSRVVRLIMMGMLPVILFGIAAGVIAGLLCGRFAQSRLFGVTAADPLVFAASVAILSAASLLAAFIPAWRASIRWSRSVTTESEREHWRRSSHG